MINSDQIICEASVSFSRDEEVILTINDDFVDLIDSESDVVFYDELKGLVTYRCALAPLGRYLQDGAFLQDLACRLDAEISVLERRDDFKIPLTNLVDIIIPPTVEIPLGFTDFITDEIDGRRYQHGTTVNLSAGGICFKCTFEYEVGQVLTIFFHSEGEKRIKLTAQVLRKIDSETIDPVFAYGCKFLDMASATETTLRSYVFKLQMQKYRRR